MKTSHVFQTSTVTFVTFRANLIVWLCGYLPVLLTQAQWCCLYVVLLFSHLQLERCKLEILRNSLPHCKFLYIKVGIFWQTQSFRAVHIFNVFFRRSIVFFAECITFFLTLLKNHCRLIEISRSSCWCWCWLLGGHATSRYKRTWSKF